MMLLVTFYIAASPKGEMGREHGPAGSAMML